MAKKKINTLRGKRIVTGDLNHITMDEIHVKDTSKGVEVTERDKNGKLVNVNVPQSGGEESGGGDAPSQPSGGNMEYWDVTAAPGGASEISPFLLLLKYTRNEMQYIQSIVSIRSTGVTPIAVALDRSVKVANSKGQVLTVGEYFQQMGFSDFSAGGWVQITEEQFYTI